MRTSRRAIAAAAVFALALTACAGDDGDSDAATDTAADTDTEVEQDSDAGDDGTEAATEDEGPEDEEESDAAAGGATVALASTDLGDVLVDADGMTLYLFDIDAQGPSQCYDDCEANWPPLLTEGDPVAGAGADEDLLGTAERDDGTLQVTYDGWPLYYFIADQAPGDVAGQAVQDVWWVLDASGAPVQAAAAGDDDGDDGDADDRSGGYEY